ncbi:MAG: phosphoribosylaminoimidazolesuccinocarboxamide synthase, partial [Ferruginibacter sp.]
MTTFSFEHQTGFYRGKVRDVYSISNDLLVMIASDRLSAFDVILPRQIPFKG